MTKIKILLDNWDETLDIVVDMTMEEAKDYLRKEMDWNSFLLLDDYFFHVDKIVVVKLEEIS